MFDFQYLQMLLMRVDILIHREVKRWQRANADAADLLRGQYISDAEVNALLKQPFGSHWRYMVAPPTAAEGEVYGRSLARTDEQIAQLLGRHPDETPRLLHLQKAFGLSDLERDVLLLTLAPALDLRYERLYGYLLDDATRKRPSVNLLLDLLCPPGPERLRHLALFSSEGTLLKNEFIRPVAEAGMSQPPLLNMAVVPDPALVSWLVGDYVPHAELGDLVKLWPPSEPSQTDWIIAAERLRELASSTAEWPLFAFHGPDELGQRAAARLVAGQMGRPILFIDIAALLKQELIATRAVRLALRDALLNRAIPYLFGWDACLADNATPRTLLQQLSQHPDFLFVASHKRWQAHAVDNGRTLLWLEFPIPSFRQRRQLWNHLMGPAAAEFSIDKLAGQFALTTEQIRDVVITARDKGVQHGRGLEDEDLFAAARAHSNPRLGDLARKITPRYTWDDLVLPRDPVTILREIVDTVLRRPIVLDEWGIGQKLASGGVTVLFAGPPGTGKTMAAEVIARELGLDLYKIDLSGVVSKYIGETEKNLERIFNEAQSSNAILFFDEADSIFGKRSEVKDAHDRYANIEVSYLLQRMEAYDGVTILATNLRANLDEAFTRRLQFAVDMPFPEAEDRLRIWRTLFPPDLPHDDDLDFMLLAKRFKLAGGNIRNVIVSAAYLAAGNGHKVTMEHLLHGTRRELQKMGLLVDKDDLKV